MTAQVNSSTGVAPGRAATLLRELAAEPAPDMTLPPLPLWRDDAGRSWWGPDELTGEHLLAYGAACAAAERERCAKALDRTGNDHCAAAIRAMPAEIATHPEQS